MAKRNKYGAKRTEVYGKTFASKAEAARYVQLRAWEKQGRIRDLEIHPSWTFACGAKYTADFRYTDSGVFDTVEDVKGYLGRIPEAVGLRWRLLKHEYGIDVEIVTMNGANVRQLLALAKGKTL